MRKKFKECVREKVEIKRRGEKMTRQGRQGTYTEGTATLFPSPPLLYEHREETHTHTATKNTKGVVTHRTRKGGSGKREGGRDGLIHDEREKKYRKVQVKTQESGVSTQREMRCHRGKGKRETERGGTENESLIRHQSSSEGGRETLTTNTGGSWCQNRVIQYRQGHHEYAQSMAPQSQEQ